jgi:uncharacterized protein YggU (UPF0235/DUF167 family)
MAAPHPPGHAGAVVNDVPHPAARRGRRPVSGQTHLTVRVHPKARTERLERDGSTLQLQVGEPPADGRVNAAVIRAVARWAGVAPSQVATVSGTSNVTSDQVKLAGSADRLAAAGGRQLAVNVSEVRLC